MKKGRLLPPFALVALAAGLPAALLAQSTSPRRTPVVSVVERVSPSVVNISAESIVREVDPFFGNFFGGSRQRKSQSLGSGLIVDASGLVVTNEHVIEGASKILVTTLDGRELEATVLGSDRDADLAVLKVAVKGRDQDGAAPARQSEPRHRRPHDRLRRIVGPALARQLVEHDASGG